MGAAENVRSVDWWLRDRRPGRTGRVLGQVPNAPALVTAATASAAGLSYLGGRRRLARICALLAAGASAVWSAGEITSGVNPVRRLLGGLALVATLALAVHAGRRPSGGRVRQG